MGDVASLRAMAAAAGPTLALLVLASATTAARQPTVKCTSGTTLFVHQGLRIFAVSQRVDYSFNGRSVVEYACRGRRSRPIRLGENYTDEGNQGAYRIDGYALSGSRYIGLTTNFSGGESCGTSHFILRDVRSRHPVHTSPEGCGFEEETESDDLVVTPAGGLAYLKTYQSGPDINALVIALKPGRDSKPVQLSVKDPKVAASDIAARGELVYWTETPQGGTAVARSRALGPGTGGPESQAFRDPERPRKSGSCVRRGRTLAQTVLVRVVERGGRRSACRVTKSAGVALPAGKLRDLQIAAERWVLALQARTATIADVTGRRSRVIQLPAGVKEASLLDDGSFAWIETSGRLLVQRPGTAAPSVLAEAAGAPTALASRDKTIYWTQADGPHRATV